MKLMKRICSLQLCIQPCFNCSRNASNIGSSHISLCTHARPRRRTQLSEPCAPVCITVKAQFIASPRPFRPLHRHAAWIVDTIDDLTTMESSDPVDTWLCHAGLIWPIHRFYKKELVFLSLDHSKLTSRFSRINSRHESMLRHVITYIAISGQQYLHERRCSILQNLTRKCGHLVSKIEHIALALAIDSISRSIGHHGYLSETLRFRF